MHSIYADIVRLNREAQPPANRWPDAPETAAAQRYLCASGEDAHAFPLSFAQERLWFIDRLEPNSPVYNILVPFRLNGPLNIGALEQAVNEIVRRHAVFRTTFPAERPVQLVATALRITLRLVDLSHLPDAAREQVQRDLAAAEGQRPFQLASDPPLRVTLLRLHPTAHVILFSIHHIISDHWSNGIFLQELVTLYEDFAAGRPASLAEPSFQYVDYAYWQRQWLQGEVLERHLAYWTQLLSGRSPVLDLPTDYPRPAMQSFNGAIYPFTLPTDLSRSLKSLSRQEGATLFMLLLAAFQTLLYRYTEQRDIIVGTPIANRNRIELRGLIGLFINVLPLCTDMSGNPSFRQLLARVRELCLNAYRHQDLPFEKLVQELQLPRDLSRPALFQVMFTLQNAPQPNLVFPDITHSSMVIDGQPSKYEMTCNLIEGPNGLVGSVEYNTDLFAAPSIVRMVEHFGILLEAISRNPDQPISTLPLLTPGEQQQMLVEWNNTSVAYPPMLCLHQLIEAQIQRSADAVAVSFGDAQVSYAALHHRANQLAHYLQRLGVGPEICVGVCLERSLELVIALLGILKAGGAYVPLDPSYPPERLHMMIEDARPLIVLTRQSSGYAGQQSPAEQPASPFSLQGFGAQVIDLEAAWPTIAHERGDTPPSRVQPDNLAYVIFTSGSTGRPKGAMNTHRAICNRLQWMQATYQLEASDSVVQKTPFSFDVSVWEFFWPLMTGARLIVAQPGGHQDAAYLLRLINTAQATTLHFVPSMLQSFLDQPELKRASSLRRVICSGEALSFELQQRFFAQIDAELHNLYGPTEAAVDVTFWACERDSTRQQVPIGHPVANTTIYLLDRALQPVPIGVAGELYIGGVQVGRGYYNRPDTSAAAFIPDPFSPQPGARMYRSGDRARYRADGSIEYLGRIDQQVKLRGFRIELGDIAATLELHPAVQYSVVVVREDTPGDKRLVAYVVAADPAAAPSATDLRAWLKARLPDYMLPAAFVMLDTLPLTPNGKLDRRALPAPERANAGVATTFVAPTSPIERWLADLWMSILKIERIGIHDDFFDLGGHSLLATQVLIRIQTEYQIAIPLRDFFDAPTIAALAQRIALIQWSDRNAAMVALPASSSDIEGEL